MKSKLLFASILLLLFSFNVRSQSKPEKVISFKTEIQHDDLYNGKTFIRNDDVLIFVYDEKVKVYFDKTLEIHFVKAVEDYTDKYGNKQLTNLGVDAEGYDCYFKMTLFKKKINEEIGTFQIIYKNAKYIFHIKIYE